MKYVKISIEDEKYPRQLKEIYDPPKILYCLGNIDLLKNLCVAVVGSRKCTEYGKNLSYNIGKKLSENGITVISGLAKGIDGFSHRGALKGTGSTIAVLAGGIDSCYPREHYALRNEIESEGLLISEAEPGYVSKPYDFPKRNRIISGLCHSLIVVEAAQNSGSLITASQALTQGREVYAVPGNIYSTQSLGTNKLIKEGAMPLTTINDILLEMHIQPKIDSEVKKYLSNDELIIYGTIVNNGETSYRELCEKSDFSPGKINGILTVLEIKGLISTALGKIFIAK